MSKTNKYGLYNTLTGKWSEPFFATREDAEAWVQTQDDKDEEFGGDWTEGGTYSVVNIFDSEDVVF